MEVFQRMAFTIVEVITLEEQKERSDIWMYLSKNAYGIILRSLLLTIFIR